MAFRFCGHTGVRTPADYEEFFFSISKILFFYLSRFFFIFTNTSSTLKERNDLYVKYENKVIAPNKMKNRKIRGFFSHNDITVSVKEYNKLARNKK